MKLSTVAAVLGLAVPAFAHAKTYNLSYNSTYDNGDESLHSVVCSTGEHGLLTHGYKTFSDIPTYPYVGAAPQIRSWNSAYCGSCWKLTYTGAHGASKTINFTAIDTGDRHHDFTISLDGLDSLTGGKDMEHKQIKVTAERKPPSWCGLRKES